ncbi:MAG: hypothetical protein U9R50_04500 [Campylobacterota bacterium]|nr:hypothetical protein [Campylobacterota bacterium]
MFSPKALERVKVIEKIQKSRLEKEFLKLNQADEKAFADLGLSEDMKSC